MRGFDQPSDALFVYLSPESFVPKDHPLRPIRQMVDAALENLSPVFCQMYSYTGPPSIPPERLLKAMLLQVLYSNRGNVYHMHDGSVTTTSHDEHTLGLFLTNLMKTLNWIDLPKVDLLSYFNWVMVSELSKVTAEFASNKKGASRSKAS